MLNRVRGSDISDRHELAYTDNPPWIEFPKGFCLKPLEDNGTVCEEPMGISVVLYEANPLVNISNNHTVAIPFQVPFFPRLQSSYPSSFLLHSETQVIDATVTSRDGRVIEVNNVVNPDKLEGIQIFLSRGNKSEQALPGMYG